MRKHRVTFKAHGRRVSFLARMVATDRKHVSAKQRARGKALARKYGFVRKAGKLYRKSPRRGLIRVRH